MRNLITILISLLIGVTIGKYVISSKDNISSENKPEQTIKNKIKWKMASTFPSSLAQIGTLGVRLEDRLKTVSDGNLQIKFFEPGALVPALEVFDAVSSGATDAGWSTPGYWAGKIPALPLFSAVPFGPPASEYMAWIYHGGGLKLFQEIYARHNIHGILCGIIPPEASGWFRNEIKSTEDLTGLKMRFFGLGAQVMEKIGVSTQLIAGGDIFPALELGTIDATEFSMPAIDLELGFYQVAKHYYFPGWHQQSTFLELLINLDKWNSMPEAWQTLFQELAREYSRRSAELALEKAEQALRALISEGAIVSKLSPREKDVWINSLPPLGEDWVRRYERKGLPAKRVVVDLMNGLRAKGIEPMRAWDSEVK